MIKLADLTTVAILAEAALQLAFVTRAILRPHREAAARLTWVVVILVLPVLGILLYILLGEVNTGRKHIERMRLAGRSLPALPEPRQAAWPAVPRRYAHIFRAGQSVNGFPPVGGNRVELLASEEAWVDRLVRDIDAAREHVHLVIYIWLDDMSGRRIAQALIRAAGRSVACRAMADDFGARWMIRSDLWPAMAEAGVKLVRTLPIGNLVLHPFYARVDIRDHRKIVVIDNRITYCGSQNFADREFHVEARYAPWIDVMLRFEGPVALQNQRVFAADWLGYARENLGHLLAEPDALAVEPGVTAQVIATGPLVRPSSMPEVFATMMYAARRELVISTPYYIPDETLQAALCAAARRGIDTHLILPARNNSRIVAWASRAYYRELLHAGVRIHEYMGGLLHAKTLVVDRGAMMVGSANLDRRSFHLNYENNIVLSDPGLAADLRQRQQEYIESAREVSEAEVLDWSRSRRLLYNGVAMFSPIL